MPAFPEGQPAPATGELPTAALNPSGRPLAAYVHVPCCDVRCGYCDFNTYTARDLGPGADRETFAETVTHEIELSRRVLRAASRPLDTIFFGGGTPTLLPAAHLGAVTDRLVGAFGAVPNLELTTEANPDTLDDRYAAALAAAGFTRVSIGMQSADPAVLRVLDRTHDPANVATAVRAARTAGLDVSLDLIYGTPGESDRSWAASVTAAIDLEPDHISAYALGVEEGTKLGAQVRRGVVPNVDADTQADRYEIADDLLDGAGYDWYEVSNWARPGKACRHNLHYWRGADWWGYGPGAHSHVGGVRWWNVKHPRAYAGRLLAGTSPAFAREVLTREQRHEEHVMLGVRLADGIEVPAEGRVAAPQLAADGLIDADDLGRGRIALTRRGRLLADRVTYALLGL